ncbi:MAG: hypothetical protein PHW02_03040 [bacterium]|nr:hypothetical protein [bacterium]
MKKILMFIVFTIIALSQLDANVLTRESVISNANSYLTITAWTPLKDTLIISEDDIWESWYQTGNNYTVMPYTFGRFDNISRFLERIRDEKVPGGIGTSSLSYVVRDTRMAGLDCAGFIMRCFEYPDNERYNSWKDIRAVTIQLENDSILKSGDWINQIVEIEGTDTTTHQILCKSRINSKKFDVYESTSSIINADYPGVQYNGSKTIEDKIPYSIFPQFSECTPKDSSTVAENDIEIGVTVRCKGEVDKQHTKIIVNNSTITEYEIETVNNTEKIYRIRFNYTIKSYLKSIQNKDFV